MNVPTSVGAPRAGADKSGQTCVIYDIIVNPAVLQEAREDVTGKYRDFLGQLAITCIEQKYKEELDKRYKLPKLKCMGELQSQYIQDRKNMPKIEEVSSQSSSSTSKGIHKHGHGKESAPLPAVAPDIALPHTAYWLDEDSRQRLFKDGKNFAVDDEMDTRMNIYNKLTVFSATSEYLEPMVVPDSAMYGLMIIAELAVRAIDLNQVSLKVSPFKFQVGDDPQ
jgi:PIH1 N-terminal domain